MYEDMDPSMGPSEGEDIHLNVSIPFLDAVHGCEKDIRYEKMIACTHCSGKGFEPNSPSMTCPTCHGSGYQQVSSIRFSSRID